MENLKNNINILIILERILVHTPTRRPTIDQMLSSQWILNNRHIENTTHIHKSKKSIFSLSLSGHTTSSSRSERSLNKKNRRNVTRCGKDCSPDLNQLTTIQCNTKRANSVMVENFLNPIDNLSNQSNDEIIENNIQRSKRSIFSASLKKKIGPMEQEKERGNLNFTKKNSHDLIKITTSDVSQNSNDSKKDSISSIDSNKSELTNEYDEEEGEFVMLPTCTSDLTHLHQMEIETRRILLNLGVTSEMLIRSVSSGPRSDIIGAYRIIINRIQKQALLAKQAELIAQEELNKPKTNRTCAIL